MESAIVICCNARASIAGVAASAAAPCLAVKSHAMLLLSGHADGRLFNAAQSSATAKAAGDGCFVLGFGHESVEHRSMESVVHGGGSELTEPSIKQLMGMREQVDEPSTM